MRVTGFGVGSQVFLSECATAAVATDLGCGAPPLSQDQFTIVTGGDRSGTSTFTVSRLAASSPMETSPRVACAGACVLVATLGEGRALVVAPISFAVP